MRIGQVLTGVLLTSILFVGTGCFSSNPEDINAFIKPGQVDVTAKTYILQPPDEIEVHCSKVPELHLQRQQIRPDGVVSFENFGEIQAAGRTPSELASVLRERVLSRYTLTGDQPVDVRVTLTTSKKYYVLGQVYLPGPKMYTGRDTALSAIAMARPNVLAWLERVQVIRPGQGGDDRPRIFELNFDRMMAHGDLSKNVLLNEGDIIYVPPTILAAVGMKVEEFLRPIGRAFSTVNIAQGPAVR